MHLIIGLFDQLHHCDFTLEEWHHTSKSSLLISLFAIRHLMCWLRCTDTDCFIEWYSVSFSCTQRLFIDPCVCMFVCENVCVCGVGCIMTVMHLIAVPPSVRNLSSYLQRTQWESVWHTLSTDLWWIDSFKNTLNFCNRGENTVAFSDFALIHSHSYSPSPVSLVFSHTQTHTHTNKHADKKRIRNTSVHATSDKDRYTHLTHVQTHTYFWRWTSSNLRTSPHENLPSEHRWDS